MCTLAIFPKTADGPVMAFGLDDAVDWLENYRDPPAPVPPSQPENGIFGLGTGGASYDYELESAVPFPRPIPNGPASLADIEQFMKKYAHFASQPGQRAWLDLRSGETLAGEWSVGDSDVWYPGDDGVTFNTYGGCQSPKLRRLCDPKSPQFVYYEKRMATMSRIIDEHRDNLGVDVMWKVMLSREPGGEVCQHIDTRPPGIHFITFQIYVIAPALGRYWVRRVTEGKAPDEVDPIEVRFDPWLCADGA